MKRTFIIVAIFAMALFGFSSCKKNTGSTPTEKCWKVTVTVTEDGVPDTDSQYMWGSQEAMEASIEVTLQMYKDQGVPDGAITVTKEEASQYNSKADCENANISK